MVGPEAFGGFVVRLWRGGGGKCFTFEGRGIGALGGGDRSRLIRWSWARVGFFGF